MITKGEKVLGTEKEKMRERKEKIRDKNYTCFLYIINFLMLSELFIVFPDFSLMTI